MNIKKNLIDYFNLLTKQTRLPKIALFSKFKSVLISPPNSIPKLPVSNNSNNFEQYMDCTKLCESQASQLFPESTTLTSIDLSVYDDTGGNDYYDEDPYGKYSHLVANKGILIIPIFSSCIQ